MLTIKDKISIISGWVQAWADESENGDYILQLVDEVKEGIYKGKEAGR